MGKGYAFEIEEVDFWRSIFPNISEDHIFRVEGSGRNKLASKTGTASILEGDVSLELGKVGILPKDILIECKHHKSHTVQKSVSVKKEWVDQALHEAIKNGRWSIVAIKFKNIRPNSKDLRKYCWYNKKFANSVHYIVPQVHFQEILRYIEEIKKIKSETVVDLSQVSVDDLLREVKKRIK